MKQFSAFLTEAKNFSSMEDFAKQLEVDLKPQVEKIKARTQRHADDVLDGRIKVDTRPGGNLDKRIVAEFRKLQIIQAATKKSGWSKNDIKEFFMFAIGKKVNSFDMNSQEFSDFLSRTYPEALSGVKSKII